MQWADGVGLVFLGLILSVAPFVDNDLTGLLAAAAGGYWLLLSATEPRKGDWLTGPQLPLLLYWGIALVAVACSPVKSAALYGLVKLTLYLLFFALATRVMRSPHRQNIAILVVLLVALVVSIYGVRQEFFGAEALATWNDPTAPNADDTRVYSYLGNPNLLGSYLLPAIALSGGALMVWRSWAQKALAVTMLITNGACLFFTDSRGAWLGLVVSGAIFGGFSYLWHHDRLPQFWRKWLVPMLLGGITLVLAIAFSQSESLRFRILSIFAGRQDSSNNFRLNVWISVSQMIRDHWLLGIGPGNKAFNLVYPLYMQPRFSALSAYSIYLETLVETGVVGFSCWLWFLLVTARHGWQRIQTLQHQNDRRTYWLIAALAGMGGLLTHGFFDTVWYRPEVNLLWWLLVAIVVAQGASLPVALSPETNDNE